MFFYILDSTNSSTVINMFVQNKYIVFLNRYNEDFANRGMYLVQKEVVPNGVGVYYNTYYC